MADYAKQQQQKIKEATDRLESGIKDFFHNGNYQDYLKVMSRFHSYSYSNSILIALQKPDATLLAGYAAWQKNFKRHVLPGEHGIKIFAPAPVKTQIEREKKDPDTNLPILDENGEPVMEIAEIKTPRFKIVSVFDVSQTDGEPLPTLDIEELTASVQGYQNLFSAVEYASAVPIIFAPLDNDIKGYFSPQEQNIHIQEGMSNAQTIKTALHELAHSKLHNIDLSLPPSGQKVQKDRNTKEVEAESIAYVVCQHFGIDTSDYSFGYVATWSQNKELPELKSSLDTIRRTAASIINTMEEKLTELQLAQEKEQIQDQIPQSNPRSMTEEEIKDFTYEQYKSKLQQSPIPDIEPYLADFERLYAEGQLDNLKPTPEQQQITEEPALSSATVIDSHDPDTPSRLAADLDDFISSYDPHMSKSALPDLTEDIAGGTAVYLKEWLNTIIQDEEDFRPQAQELLRRMDSFPPEPDPEEAAFELNGHYLYLQTASDNSWDYTYYDAFLNVIDGGQIGDENMDFNTAKDEILEMLNQKDIPLKEIPAEQLEQMIEEHENDLHCPVYLEDIAAAREKGELDSWRISHNANCTCSRQFQSEYERAYADRTVPEFLQKMVDRYGMQRCKIVVASTIQLSPKDGRYTPEMKQAAAQVYVPGTNSNPSYDRRFEYQINCHPVTVNVAMRDLLSLEQEQTKNQSTTKQKTDKTRESKKRTSIRAKLEKNKALLASGEGKSEPAGRDKPQL